jgi:hypothetical protein
MSRGLGRIERECLRIIEAAGKELTTFSIAAEVYRVKRNKNGDRWINDAQHVGTKRALASLRRKGLVTGQQKVTVKDGQKILSVVGADGIRAERCCFWAAR